MTRETVSSMDQPGSGLTLSSGVFKYCHLRCHRWQLSPTSKLSTSRNNLVPDLQPLQFIAWHISLNHLCRLVNASVPQTYPPACESQQLKICSPFTLAAPAAADGQLLVTVASVATRTTMLSPPPSSGRSQLTVTGVATSQSEHVPGAILPIALALLTNSLLGQNVLQTLF